ncbi:tripartite tricarboxylate transporter permease [Hydromonas duriensis]|uniref:Putative tricarboxylic transport membrane protein n=1 Tax=Hydromonas duriensis TaxID=1527608 RepID=A0A4R6YA44_9BURK|nr:tripartite tricarboxylate transporter permease [Hydromonas duriensis]TDR32368.1 putative tricarboxylic transport membrane protein [Hydromonas duriensis]
MSTLDYLMQGFSVSFLWYNLLFAFMGCLLGTVVGVLPGIGPMSGVALLIPITASITSSIGLSNEQAATSSIILLSGVYYGAMYGGSTTSILLNTPGESSSVVTALDGYQMAKQGRAGSALSIAAIGSFIGGIVTLVALILMAEPLSEMAIKFTSVEYFSLMILGLCAVSGLAGKSMTKALIMTTLGLLIATIGHDGLSGQERFIFGFDSLSDGVAFLTLAVGFFAVVEVFKTILEADTKDIQIAKITRLYPSMDEMKESAGPIARGSILGFFIGILPGAGAILASFFSYIMEKKLSKTPEKFGHGAIAGVAGPETANNAASGGAMVPLLTLGIPSSGTAAILMGALIMYNVQPGPLLFSEHPTVAWGLIASMFIGNVMLLVLNLPLVRVFAKVISTPARYLLPLILAISVFGVLSTQNTMIDLWILVICGILGLWLNKHDYPVAPMVLSVILGPMMEANLGRALSKSEGDWSVFFSPSHPVSLAFMTFAILWISIPLLLKMRGKEVLVNEEG